MAQKVLVGKACCSVHSRMTSASMRNITKPRNASMASMRVRVATAGAAWDWDDREGARVLMMPAFYPSTRS